MKKMMDSGEQRKEWQRTGKRGKDKRGTNKRMGKKEMGRG